ncbi:MAG: serine hydroxymethyltransferase [Anaerolineae bacterium]|nr:serine hydroxymethyltransferase [Anaerolineae bacterium]
MQNIEPIRQVDPDIYAAIGAELTRQQTGVELIPSENYVSEAVLAAIGTVLTNKYSEGYPGKRYYMGNHHIDTVENLAIERAKALFGAEAANVQSYSGSPANQAIYMALAKPGDTIMGMSLPDGGHLTHGWKVNFSAHYYHAVQYPVDPETGFLDYDVVAKLAREHKPRLLWAGHSAYPRQLDFAKFADIAGEVGALLIADVAHISGLIATGLHPDPVPYAAAMMTTTHKMLRGPRGALIVGKEEHLKAINRAVFPGLQGGPHNHTTAGIAVCLLEASQPGYRAYCEQLLANAQALAEALLSRGLDIVSGGTENHIVLLDLRSKNQSGKVLSQVLDRANITTNANTVPGEIRSPFDPSGVRLGTPAATTRGFREAEFRQVGHWIADIAADMENEQTIERVRNEVVEMCSRFPLWY